MGGGISLNRLEERISELANDEALENVGYLAYWMKENAKDSGKLASMEISPDDQSAVEMLRDALPEISDSIKRISYDENFKGQVAKNFLIYLSRQKNYANKVEEAFDRPILRGEPFTISLGASILMLLFLEFDLKYSNKKGEKRLQISKKAPVLDIIAKLLGL